MSVENTIITKDLFAVQRLLKNEKHEVLINFHDKFSEKMLSCVKKKFKDLEKVFIYIDDEFSETLTQEYNYNMTISESQSYPWYYTKDPINVSLGDHTFWKDVKNKLILPSKNNDWDFFESSFLLKKLVFSFGFFDFDSMLIIPTYPKDLTNNLIHPRIVLYHCNRYIEKNGSLKFRTNFYALWLFCKDRLGKKLLYLFYEESIQPTIEISKVIQKLHKIYHTTSDLNPYKPFLFYQAHCSGSSAKKFDIQRYILTYLSFHCVFFCKDFVKQRKSFIWRAILTSPKMFFLKKFVKNPEELEEQINKIHETLGEEKNQVWLSRSHLRKVKTPFSKYLVNNWHYLRRNLNLWDISILRFDDSQLVYGRPLVTVIPTEWVSNFEDSKYIFVEKKKVKPNKVKI